MCESKGSHSKYGQRRRSAASNLGFLLNHLRMWRANNAFLKLGSGTGKDEISRQYVTCYGTSGVYTSHDTDRTCTPRTTRSFYIL